MPVDGEADHPSDHHADHQTDHEGAPPRPGTSRSPMGRIVLVAAVVVTLAVAGVALGVAASQSSGAVVRPAPGCGAHAAKLTVQGTGQATGTPDLLTVALQVSASGPSATAALSKDNALAGAVVNAYKAGNVAEKDIQTANLSLQPQYVYPRGVPTLTGYQVNNTITATLHDVSSAGAVIDAVVTAGGNAVQIQSIGFSSSDPSQVGAKARGRATAQAVARAKALALAAGDRLGPLCSLTDQPSVSVIQGEPSNLAFSDSGAATAPVPIEAGTQKQSAHVTLVYALAPAAVRTH